MVKMQSQPNGERPDLQHAVAAIIHESRQIRAEAEVKITNLRMEVERCRRVRERFRKACRNGKIWVPPLKFIGSLR
jgi:hypothetical protein